MNSLRLILDICLLRGRTQDLPVSGSLVVQAALASMAVDFLGLADPDVGLGHFLFVFTRPLMYGLALWLVLKGRGFPERWWQAAAAMFSVLAIFTLVRLPLLPALGQAVSEGPGATWPWQVFASLAIEIWFLVVMARILREALEIRMPLAVLSAVVMVFSVEILRLVLAPFFGLMVPV